MDRVAASKRCHASQARILPQLPRSAPRPYAGTSQIAPAADLSARARLHARSQRHEHLPLASAEPPFPSPAAPSRLVRLLFWHRKTRAEAASGPPHPARPERRAGLGLAGLVSRAPAPANRASPGRSDRTTCLPARSQGLLACGGGLEVRSSQAGALMALHNLVTPCSLQLPRPPWRQAPSRR